jgi:hypothetical protein
LRRQPPGVSQDAHVLLAGLGYAPSRVDALIAAGVVAGTVPA